jgi:hypothetical protein
VKDFRSWIRENSVVSGQLPEVSRLWLPKNTPVFTEAKCFTALPVRDGGQTIKSTGRYAAGYLELRFSIARQAITSFPSKINTDQSPIINHPLPNHPRHQQSQTLSASKKFRTGSPRQILLPQF